MHHRLWIAAVCACVLSACSAPALAPAEPHAAAGHLFSPGAFNTLAVGYASREAAMAAMGATPTQSDVVVFREDLADQALANPVIGQRLQFVYVGPASEGSGVEPRARRLVYLTFSEGKLISFQRSSTFQSDSTAFREALVTRLAKGRSTQSEVRQLLGAPAGQSLYPISKAPGHTRWTYWQQWWGGNGMYGQFLTLDFDASGVLQDFSLEAGRY
jgi:hypothetical protein